MPKRSVPYWRERRVLVAEANQMLGSALGLLLTREPGVQVIGEATDARSLLSAAQVGRPDAIVLDWDLPGWDADTMLDVLRSDCPDVVVVGLCTRPERRCEVLDAGAHAFLTTVDAPLDVLSVLRVLLAVTV